MGWVIKLLAAIYAVVAFFFAAAGVALIAFATKSFWSAVTGAEHQVERIVESLGTFAVALVALEIAQTVVEEEVVRRAQVSAPTRVRRYLSRFLVVIVVALSIKYLVAVVRFLEEDPRVLWNASSIGITTAVLLIAWAIFIGQNRGAEELEPEAMADAKREDKKVQ
jgi:hypothetical protein